MRMLNASFVISYLVGKPGERKDWILNWLNLIQWYDFSVRIHLSKTLEVMASNSLLMPYIWAFRLGSSLYKIFPCVYTWDGENHFLKVDYGWELSIPYVPGIRIQAGKVVPLLFTLIQFMNILHVLYVITSRDASLGDIFLGSMVLGPFSMALAAHVNLYISLGEFCSLTNSLDILGSRFCKYLSKTNTREVWQVPILNGML
jgi:hypothetical protein